MARCGWTQDFDGVVVGCKLPHGHDDPNLDIGPPYLHALTCHTCAGQIPDAFPEPGMRCIKHRTREPNPNHVWPG